MLVTRSVIVMVASCSSLFSLADACCIFPIAFIRLMLHRCIFMESAMHMNHAGPLSCLVVPCISVVLLTPDYVSMCSQPSRGVLVARFLLKHVTALIVVAGCVRGPDRSQSRIFLPDVVHNAWFAYFQWPVARSSVRAAVCCFSSASTKNAAGSFR